LPNLRVASRHGVAHAFARGLQSYALWQRTALIAQPPQAGTTPAIKQGNGKCSILVIVCERKMN